MKLIAQLVGCCLPLILLVGCHSNQFNKKDSKRSDIVTEKKIFLPIEGKNGTSVTGVAKFYSLKNGTVLLQLEAKNLSPGLHAIHIHENPDCSAVDGSSAGGHWNPTQQKHGRWGHQKGYHQGDIGVFLVDKEGEADYTFKTTTDSWCIGCSDSSKNILEHSIILHSDPDDFTTQPTGNAGRIIACGIIR